MPLRANGQVKLMDQRQAGKSNPHPFRFGECNAHVLDEVFDKKSWSKIALDDARRQVVERPARGGDTTNAIDQ
jgi:hypothetical protein